MRRFVFVVYLLLLDSAYLFRLGGILSEGTPIGDQEQPDCHNEICGKCKGRKSLANQHRLHAPEIEHTRMGFVNPMRSRQVEFSVKSVYSENEWLEN